jgi:hypothetical protein
MSDVRALTGGRPGLNDSCPDADSHEVDFRRIRTLACRVLPGFVGALALLGATGAPARGSSGGAGLQSTSSAPLVLEGSGGASAAAPKPRPKPKPKPKPTKPRAHAHAVRPAAPNRYVDPFTDPSWQPARTDMGVDWVPVRRLPVLAIGNALILGSDSKSGWPGGHIIWYQLLDGTHAGDIIYVAEHLTRLLPAGQTVHAGQQIAIAVPGYPYIETGWADTHGSPRAYPCYKEGKQTHSGKEMARFLVSLGAVVADPPGAVPNKPSGKLC